MRSLPAITEQQANLLRDVLLGRVGENARLLTRISITAPEAWLKDVRREMDTAIELLSYLRPGFTPEVIQGGKSDPATSMVVAACTCYPAPGGAEINPDCPHHGKDAVPAELAEMGVTLAEHRRASNPVCTHGRAFTEPCPECDKGPNVPQAGANSVT